jgi:hypothetical protein
VLYGRKYNIFARITETYHNFVRATTPKPWSKKVGIPLDYNQKQCIKSPQTRLINSSTSPFRFHEGPGLHIFHIRISHALPPGAGETFQVVFGKRVACLHEKTSLFNLFCISFRTHLKFDRRLVYNALLLLSMIAMIDE